MFEIARCRTAGVLAVFTLALLGPSQRVAAQATTVVCESTQGERAFCSADTGRGVTLQRQLGEAPCEGNWGSDSSGIWVANGCRAEFLLGETAPAAGARTSLVSDLVDVLKGGQSTTTQADKSLVVCESKDNRRVTCPVDARGGVELTRQLSRASCDGVWGHTADGIWVDKGCRAEFRVKPVEVVEPVEPVRTAAPVKPERTAAPVEPARTKTPAPAQTLTCESKDNLRAFCSADTRGGVDLVRPLGRASCLGHWGYDSDGIWVDAGCRAEFKVLPVTVTAAAAEGTIICSSKKNGRSFCSANTLSGVELQRQLSEASCVGNWGFDADGIWVDNGCSAIFRMSKVMPTPTVAIKPSAAALPGPGSVVTCQSTDGRRNYCPADTRTGVKLQRQLGTAPCVGHWGHDGRGIWVADGCRAEFLIIAR